MKTYQPHQQRVIDEKSELDKKLVNLKVFIGGPIWRGLSEVEQSRLNRQLEAMTAYSNILGGRIGDF